MEYRDDLRLLLLDGLPTDARRETLRTIDRAREAKLAKLRSADWQAGESAELADEHLDR
jgi:hypothetical protein